MRACSIHPNFYGADFIENCTKVLELLIDKSAAINEGDNNGNTALHITCKNGYIERAKFLIDKGCDVM